MGKTIQFYISDQSLTYNFSSSWPYRYLLSLIKMCYMHNMRHFLNILQLMSHYSELENHCKEMEVEINGDFAGKIFAAPGTQTHNLPT